MQATLDRYVVHVGDDRKLGFGDELGDAIAWVEDALASGRSAAVWTLDRYPDAELRRVWPQPEEHASG